MAVVSPERNRAAGALTGGGGVTSPLRPEVRGGSPLRVGAGGMVGRQMVSDVLPGTVVYLLRQQCVRAEVPVREDGDVEHVDPLPEAMRPAKAVLGVYLNRELAEFYMERAIHAVLQKHLADKQQEPEGASSAAPDGLSEDVWRRLRAAADSSTAPSKIPDSGCDLGYKWTYRKWNIVVSVWIQRMAVDLPPVAELW